MRPKYALPQLQLLARLMRATSVRAPIRNVQRVRRVLSDGSSRLHFYHRPTGRRLPEPTNPEFAAAYEAAERQLASARQAVQGGHSQTKMLSPPLSPKIGRAEPQCATSKPKEFARTISRSRVKKSAPPVHDMPLYPDEDQIAFAVLGPGRAHEWKAKAIILERQGLPPIDPLMGGRMWLAVVQFFASQNVLDERIVAGVKSPTIGRVRRVPFVPDGREVLDGKEETAPASGASKHRSRRAGI